MRKASSARDKAQECVTDDVSAPLYSRGKPASGKAKKAVVPEKRVKEQIRRVLKSLGIWYCTPIGAGFGPAAHDFVCCVPVKNGHGQLVSIEAKASNGKLRPRQIETCKAIQDANGIVLLVYPEDVAQLGGALCAVMDGTLPPKGA